MKKPFYPNLAVEMAKKGIKPSEIARELGFTQNAIYRRFRGETKFLVDEAIDIWMSFFPEVPLHELFYHEKEV